MKTKCLKCRNLSLWEINKRGLYNFSKKSNYYAKADRNALIIGISALIQLK